MSEVITQRTPCEIFSRSMGFIRPVSNFNIGKYCDPNGQKIGAGSDGLYS